MSGILSVRDLTLSYGKHPAVSVASFDVSAGDFVAIIGPNGSGKTTLVRALVGLHKPSSGSIEWTGNSGRQPHIGYLPQNALAGDDLFPATVREIVSTGLYERSKGLRLFSPIDYARVNEVMRRLRIDELAPRRIGKLSGGQKQRALLARALVATPDLLVLDEPTSALDPGFRDEFYSILDELNSKDGITILLISHDIGSVAKYTKRMIYLDRKLVFSGTYEDFCKSEEMTSYFGSMTQHQMCGRHAHDHDD
jgi:zinc transport system ATP-binding protein